MKTTQKQWAIFYRVNGKLFGCATHLGLVILSSEEVNVYCDKAKLQEIFDQTVAKVHRSKPATSGHAKWEGELKPEYRHGEVFIARVGSKDFPVKLLKAPRFQDDAPEYPKGKPVWALRVPFEFI